MAGRKLSGAKINDELLMELVRKHRVLYDVSHAQYGDSKVKDVLWSDLGRTLAADGASCKLRWNNIRDQYRKRLKEFNAKGKRPVHSKVYKYSKQLSFLVPFLNFETSNNSNKVSGKTEVDMNSQSANKPHTDPLDITRTRTMSQSSEDSQTSESTNLFEDLSKKTAESLVEYLLKKHEVETRPLDPVDTFLAALAPPLKALSPHQLHLARGELFAVVHKYESQMFKDQDGRVNARERHDFELQSKVED